MGAKNTLTKVEYMYDQSSRSESVAIISASFTGGIINSPPSSGRNL